MQPGSEERFSHQGIGKPIGRDRVVVHYVSFSTSYICLFIVTREPDVHKPRLLVHKLCKRNVHDVFWSGQRR